MSRFFRPLLDLFGGDDDEDNPSSTTLDKSVPNKRGSTLSTTTSTPHRKSSREGRSSHYSQNKSRSVSASVSPSPQATMVKSSKTNGAKIPQPAPMRQIPLPIRIMTTEIKIYALKHPDNLDERTYCIVWSRLDTQQFYFFCKNEANGNANKLLQSATSYCDTSKLNQDLHKRYAWRTLVDADREETWPLIAAVLEYELLLLFKTQKHLTSLVIRWNAYDKKRREPQLDVTGIQQTRFEALLPAAPASSEKSMHSYISGDMHTVQRRNAAAPSSSSTTSVTSSRSAPLVDDETYNKSRRGKRHLRKQRRASERAKKREADQRQYESNVTRNPQRKLTFAQLPKEKQRQVLQAYYENNGSALMRQSVSFVEPASITQVTKVYRNIPVEFEDVTMEKMEATTERLNETKKDQEMSAFDTRMKRLTNNTTNTNTQPSSESSSSDGSQSDSYTSDESESSRSSRSSRSWSSSASSDDDGENNKDYSSHSDSDASVSPHGTFKPITKIKRPRRTKKTRHQRQLDQLIEALALRWVGLFRLTHQEDACDMFIWWLDNEWRGWTKINPAVASLFTPSDPYDNPVDDYRTLLAAVNANNAAVPVTAQAIASVAVVTFAPEKDDISPLPPPPRPLPTNTLLGEDNTQSDVLTLTSLNSDED